VSLKVHLHWHPTRLVIDCPHPACRGLDGGVAILCNTKNGHVSLDHVTNDTTRVTCLFCLRCLETNTYVKKALLDPPPDRGVSSGNAE
jgi:hypothetical protein